MILEASEEKPVYRMFEITKPTPKSTQTYGISCDEGWREHIVCTGLYEHVATWLLGLLGNNPYPKAPYEKEQEK